MKDGLAVVVKDIAGLSRWAARVLGTLWCGLVVVFAIGEGMPSPSALPLPEQVAMAAAGLWILGCVMGWRWDAAAAAVILLASVVFHLIEGRLWLGWPLELPTLVGLLYAASWTCRTMGATHKPRMENAVH